MVNHEQGQRILGTIMKSWENISAIMIVMSYYKKSCTLQHAVSLNKKHNHSKSHQS